MKRAKNLVTAFAAVAVLLLVAACGTLSGSQDSSRRQAARADVKWTDDASGTLYIQNDVDEDVILFAGSINNRNILGGVNKLSERRVDFFSKVDSQSGTFLLRAVKESVYRSKGSQIGSDDVIYASIVSFDKADQRQISINIQKTVGGNAQIVIQNATNMALQIRVNSPTGPTLTTLAPFERDKKVYMEPRSSGYTFFPVYQYYDRSTNGIRSITAESLYDGVPMNPVVPGAGNIPTIDFQNSNIGRMFSPFATLIISNNTGRGAILLEGGSTRLTSQNGVQMFNPGNETFELDLQKQNKWNISNLSVDLGLGPNELIKIPPFDFEAECTYRVEITRGVQPKVTLMGKSDTSKLALELVNEN